MDNTSKPGTWLLAAVVMVSAFAGGMWFAASGNGTDSVPSGVLWPDPPIVPAFNLVDHQDRPFRDDELRGHWTLVFFGFTHCPDVCPTALAALARAEPDLRRTAAFGETGEIVFVSVDPERDTPAILRDYVGYFSPRFVGATAAVEELRDLTRSLGALFMKVPGKDDSYSMDHSAGIFYLSPNLELISVLTPPQSASEIVERFVTIADFIEARG